MPRSKSFLFVLPILLILGMAVFGWIIFSPVVTGDAGTSHEILIRRGTSFNKIMLQLQEQNVIKDRFRPQMVALAFGLRTKVKSGLYRIEGGLSSYDLMDQLVRGQVRSVKVTIPEGLQSRQIAAILQRRASVDSTQFMKLVRDSSFIKELNIRAESLEGYLFPNTYLLQWGISAKQAIEILVNEFHQQFNDSLRITAAKSEFTLKELITLASIIEGEAIVDSERPFISAVYHNRLRRGMLLQADPTIQYIIPDGPRRLLKQDLEIDSPYNTYKYSGLPPGPINNPGLASIIASFNPADVGYLYFVANGDGSHSFSRTLDEHLRAKAKFDQVRRQVKRDRGK